MHLLALHFGRFLQANSLPIFWGWSASLWSPNSSAQLSIKGEIYLNFVTWWVNYRDRFSTYCSLIIIFTNFCTEDCPPYKTLGYSTCSSVFIIFLQCFKLFSFLSLFNAVRLAVCVTNEFCFQFVNCLFLFPNLIGRIHCPLGFFRSNLKFFVTNLYCSPLFFLFLAESLDRQELSTSISMNSSRFHLYAFQLLLKIWHQIPQIWHRLHSINQTFMKLTNSLVQDKKFDRIVSSSERIYLKLKSEGSWLNLN